jgi:hypothetical protein
MKFNRKKLFTILSCFVCTSVLAHSNADFFYSADLRAAPSEDIVLNLATISGEVPTGNVYGHDFTASSINYKLTAANGKLICSGTDYSGSGTFNPSTMCADNFRSLKLNTDGTCSFETIAHMCFNSHNMFALAKH